MILKLEDGQRLNWPYDFHITYVLYNFQLCVVHKNIVMTSVPPLYSEEGNCFAWH